MRKFAIITGAGSGIGQATAEYFSQQSYSTILVGRRLEKLKAVQSNLKSPSWCFSLDLADQNTIKAGTAQIIKVLQQEASTIAIINNAGIYEAKSLLESNSETWSKTFQTNLFGAVEFTNALLPLMVQKKTGAIVNVSSTLGLRTSPHTGAYSASKAAMNSWTQTLALELAQYNIRANAVCPGIVDTPIHQFHSLPTEQKQNTLSQMGKLQPLGRVGQPMEIAKTIYFLASDDSAWTTGTLLSVDGGINLA